MFWTLTVFFLSLLHCFCCERCSETNLTASTRRNQTLTLPWYPNADCTWEITAKYLVVFSVVFIDTDSNCADFFEINIVNDRDQKRKNTSSLVGKFCGKKGPFTIAGKTVLVRFVSTGQKKHRGFRATYFDAGLQILDLPRVLKESDSSFRHLKSGYIFGERRWTIYAPQGHYIELNILSMDWGWDKNQGYCYSLSITNYARYRFYSEPIRVTKHIPENALQEPFASTTNKIDVIATASRNYCFSKGFHIIFLARKILANCSKTGEVVDINPGNILRVSSKDYPEQYQPNQRCVWRFQAPPGYYITVEINHIATECCCDYVEFRDGKNDTDRLLQRVSGQGTSRNLQWGEVQGKCLSYGTGLRVANTDWHERYVNSSAEYLTVIFYSDASQTDRGFLLELTADKLATERYFSTRTHHRGYNNWVRVATPVLSALGIVGIIVAIQVVRCWKKRNNQGNTKVRYQRLINDAAEESSSFVTFRDRSLFVA